MARTFNPAQHPRDRFGRFTKSRTVKANAKDRKAAAEVAERFAPKQQTRQERAAYLRQVAGRQPEGAFADVLEANKALRSGKDSDAAKRVDAAMTELPDDVLLSRAVPLSAFGSTDPVSLQGMKVRDAGFAPTQYGTVRPADGQVRMHIAAPAGTKAAVNPATGEVVLARDTEMVVAKVAKNDAGGLDMWLTVLPKQGAKTRVADNSEKTDIPAPNVADNASKTDTPEGDAAGRAELMKLRVPELQARMRERGLKSGRMRKSQMVDALVADETGSDPDEEPAPETQLVPAREPASGADALASAPFGLGREGSTLTPAQAEALTDYQSAYFQAINGQLRRGELTSSVARAVAAIDSVMADSKLTANVQVWRGRRNAAVLFGDRANGDLTGARWREDAYVSSSADERQARNFASDGEPPQPVLMRITAPAGTSAVELSPLDDQAELLIARGHEFEVTADLGVIDGVRRLDVTVGRQGPLPELAVVEPSPAWATARSGEQAFTATTMIQQAAGRLVLQRRIKQRELARVQQAAVAYGSDPRDGDLNYVTVNQAVRGHGGNVDPEAPVGIRQTVTDLDLLITAAPLPAGMLTYRGLQSPAAAIPGWREDGDNTGLEWTAEGYQSTTTDEQVARRFASGTESGGTRTTTPTVARVLLPTGTPGLAMSPVVSEILLGRNHRFRVVADRGMVDGVRQVDIELIPEVLGV